MLAIILAAGIGRRLRPLTEEIPKTLLQIRGKPIIEYAIMNLVRVGIRNILIVTGHGKEALYPVIRGIMESYSVHVTTVENVDYAKSNTALSLLKALDSMENCEDILIVNGDVLFDWHIARELVSARGTSIAVDTRKLLTSESFKIRLEGGSIVEMGKGMEIESASGEFIGISIVSRNDFPHFKNVLASLVRDDKMQYYDVAFLRLGREGGVTVVPVGDFAWTEIDTHDDYHASEAAISSFGFEI